MATTTKSKAKTKTSKKPASRARTAAAKTTRATKSTKVTKKPTVKAASTSKGKTSVLTVRTLRRLNLIKALVFAALAVAAGLLMTSASYALTVGYQAKDELVSLTEGKTAFVHGSQNLMDIEVRWIVVGIMALAAVFSLLAATRMRAKFENSLITGVSSMRWVGWGITSALMVEATALLSGVSDVKVLKLVGGLMLVTCALAWVAEKRNKQAGRPVRSEFVISLVTGILPWLLILGYAVSTWVWGLVRYPWYVYALYVVLLGGFTLLATNQYKRIQGWTNTLVLERNYLLIGLVTKAAFAVVLILGFQK
jgi:hypothetical protein